jgi:hypothetical protein
MRELNEQGENFVSMTVHIPILERTIVGATGLDYPNVRVEQPRRRGAERFRHWTCIWIELFDALLRRLWATRPA